MLDRLTIERMLAWTGEKPVLVALSGGGDSVALLHLLVSELGAARVCAAIVDHALRDGSADDAARARSSAEALGVRAEILTLNWAFGANRAQESARAARYRALCAHARLQGLNTIAAAHTADDQAETVLMRAANGSTWRGLAGIAPFAFAPVWPEGRGLALARPLLEVRRETLRAYLRDRRVAWLEDPANANTIHERVRVRARLSALQAEGFEPLRLTRLAARLRARLDRIDGEARVLVAEAAVFERDRIVLRLSAWRGSRDIRCRALGALMAAVVGAEREPSSTKLAEIERRVTSPEHRGSTHSHVEFVSLGEGAVELRRETLRRSEEPREPAMVVLEPGVETIWDNRFAVAAAEPGWRIRRSGDTPVLDRDPIFPGTQRPTLRSLAADRVAHAFAPDINRAKP
ncbi:MAG: tRNA lysidine(34) synthetase TilS [Alphaproteobacteria bacterium]|nr:tRNA lysidine(34) synthetase TilS [Alphaproteobacteria bacterium]